MSDSFSATERSEVMSKVRNKDTGPELLIRKALHARGFRYRLHVPDVPGKPDLVFPRFRSAVFINGCFWHGHRCNRFSWPSSNAEFWKAKIGKNVNRDQRNISSLSESGWRVLVVWECTVRGKGKWPLDEVVDTIGEWLLSTSSYSELAERVGPYQ